MDGTDSGIFEDEDTRQFYETLPDLKAIIPGVRYPLELFSFEITFKNIVDGLNYFFYVVLCSKTEAKKTIVGRLKTMF